MENSDDDDDDDVSPRQESHKSIDRFNPGSIPTGNLAG